VFSQVKNPFGGVDAMSEARPRSPKIVRLYDPEGMAASPAEKSPLLPAEHGADGAIDGVIVRPLKAHTDQRGWLMEVFRADELSEELLPAMAYISQTEVGVVRGPHEHVDQTDYFVFLGPGEFELYLWDARDDSPTHGCKLVYRCGQSSPCSVIVPPGVIHAYKNVGSTAGWVFNAPNRLYAGYGKREPVDEIRHEDRSDSLYRVA
jgi:dTDP-4-dehydrorhamnose 3,5-epimerase